MDNPTANMKEVYEDLKELQLLVWSGDDLMSQDTLFEIQDKLADLTLKAAAAVGQERELAAAFPWLYTVEIKEKP